MSGKMRAAIAAIAVMAVASGCAKEREPRSYVQPNIIAKADLTGRWYYAPTVVDIGFTSSVTFIGETAMDVAIIKWDIQENVLYARLAYDRIRGTESEHNPLDNVAFAGEPLGAWSITHFDIIRDYNATTGEETNTIRESTERPWYQRQFIRVDWSENLVSNWYGMMWERTVSTDPLSYFITDPDHPHSPKIERDADGNAVYFGITTKVLVQPEMVEYGYSGIDELPDCYFYGSTTSCTSTEVTIRNSFAKIDPDKEYQPRQYNQVEMDDFGYFLTERKNYNRDYGVTIGGIKWYANRHNLYGEWFRKAMTADQAAWHADADRDFECAGDGEPCRYTDDNTKVFIKARRAFESADLPTGLTAQEVHCFCDTDASKCDQPCFYVVDGSPVYVEDDVEGTEKYVERPRDRPLKPIVYYLNETFPSELLETMQGVADQWSRAFSLAVWLQAGCSYADFKTWEEGGGNACRSEFGNPDFQMLVLCRNPVVQDGDPVECGPPGRVVRLGDIRYSHVVWVDAPQQSSPLGYGPPLADPLTGEVISAIANVYGAPLDSYSVYARDIVRMLTDQNFEWDEYLWGYLQTKFVRDNFSGSYAVAQPANKNVLGQVPDKHRQSWRTRRYTRDDIKRLYNQMNRSWASAVPSSAGSGQQLGRAMTSAEQKAWIQSRLGRITNSRVLGDGTNPQQARINMLRGSYWEDLMMTPEWLTGQAAQLAAAGYDPMNVTSADLPPGSAMRRKVSPLTRLNVNYLRALNKVKHDHHAKTIMFSEFALFDEPSTVGVATETVCQVCCADSDKTYDAEAGRDVCPGWKACMASPETQTAKWATEDQCGNQVKYRLREMIFDGVTVHEMGHNMGLRHNFKGSYDAMNFFDKYWEIRKMDGTVKPRTQDPVTQQELMAKIKQYQYTSIMDYGAKFNSDFSGLGRHDYASILHTYAGFSPVFNQVNNDELISVMQASWMFSYPMPIRFYYPPGSPDAVHYTRVHYDPALADTANNAVDTAEANRDYVPKVWITEQPLGNWDVYRTDYDVEDKAGSHPSRLMVPFRNCSDEFRNSSLGCNYFDEGADLFEITENTIHSYENYYIFNNFGRDRYEWGWDDSQYTGRILGRYFDLMQNHAQYWVLWYTIFHDTGMYTPTQIDNFMMDDTEGLGTYTVAVARTFETFARVLNQPAPGWYLPYERMDGTIHWWMDRAPEYGPPPEHLFDCTDGTECYMVDYDNGKYWDDTWDFDFGYQWYLRKLRYGQFLDRPLAIQMLGEATNNFMGKDTQEDVRKYTINYARIYPDHIKALFSAINSQDLTEFAPSYCGLDAQGNTIIEHRNALALYEPRCSQSGGTFQGYVNPGDTFSSQLNATTWGMSMFPMNYSQDFLDSSRIYVLGSGEGIDWTNIPASATLVEFTDPFSFKTYQAIRYPEHNVAADPVNDPPYLVSTSIGAEMLQQALDIQVSYEYWLNEYTLDPTEENHDQMYFYRENLRSYIINLDITRATSYLFEHPDYTVAD